MAYKYCENNIYKVHAYHITARPTMRLPLTTTCCWCC